MKTFFKFMYMLALTVFCAVQGAFASIGSVIGATDNLPIANATAYNIRSLHDFHFKKSVINKLYKNYGDGFQVLDFLRMLNRYEMVSNESITMEEEGRDIRTITVGDTVSLSGSAGGTATFNLDADDFDSGNRYYPRVGFTVHLGTVITGFIQAQITSITGTSPSITITITPYNSAETITSSHLATGKEIGIFDSAYGVETGQPVGTSKGYWERTFYAQIFKETLTFGGMELAKQKWVEVEGIGFFNKEMARVEFGLDRQEEASILMGRSAGATPNINHTSLITSTNVPVQKNIGIWTWIDQLGGELTYADATGPDTTYLDEAAAYLEANGITEDIVLVGCGGKMFRRLENMSVDWFVDPTNTGTPHGSLTSDWLKKSMGVDGGLEIDVSFRAIKKGGILFILHKVPALTDPQQFGISGYMLNDAAFMLPITYVKDGKSGMTIPNLSAYYVGVNGYSRKRIVASLAGMDGFHNQNFGNPIISQIDGNNTYWLSHVMFPFMEAYKGLIWRRSS